MSCGDCTECCYVFRIDEIGKPKHTMCKECTGSGCGIYETRPQTCSGYQCEYLKKDWSEDLRPDRCGVLIDKRKGEYSALLVRNVTEEAQAPIMEKLEEFKGIELINALKGYES